MSGSFPMDDIDDEEIETIEIEGVDEEAIVANYPLVGY